MSGRLLQFGLRVLDRLVPRLVQHQEPAPDHQIIGRSGEEWAYFHLRRLGYVMVARNYRSARRKGEIDLIGWDGDVLCFIEVKTRTTHDVKPAEAAVDSRKRRAVRAVAGEYLRRLPGRPAFRFDIVSIYCEGTGAHPQITLFKNAFSMS